MSAETIKKIEDREEKKKKSTTVVHMQAKSKFTKKVIIITR